MMKLLKTFKYLAFCATVTSCAKAPDYYKCPILNNYYQPMPQISQSRQEVLMTASRLSRLVNISDYCYKKKKYGNKDSQLEYNLAQISGDNTIITFSVDNVSDRHIVFIFNRFDELGNIFAD